MLLNIVVVVARYHYRTNAAHLILVGVVAIEAHT